MDYGKDEPHGEELHVDQQDKELKAMSKLVNDRDKVKAPTSIQPLQVYFSNLHQNFMALFILPLAKMYGPASKTQCEVLKGINHCHVGASTPHSPTSPARVVVVMEKPKWTRWLAKKTDLANDFT